MNKEKLQLAVIAAGIVIFIALAAGNLRKKPTKALPEKALSAKHVEPALQSEPRPQQFAPTSETADEKDLALQKERENLAWGRDPFSASSSAKEYQRANLQLKGISLGKDKSGLAFINNEIVKKGDTIGEYEVTEIQKDKVMLRKGDQSFYLVLPQE